MGKVYSNPHARPIRRLLRRNTPKPEQLLWTYLRAKRLKGIKFRRQYSIGRYVVDFYAPQSRVVIEIDGDSHYSDQAQEYDSVRTEYFRRCGVRTIRFTNAQVMKNINGVLEEIVSICMLTRPSP